MLPSRTLRACFQTCRPYIEKNNISTSLSTTPRLNVVSPAHPAKIPGLALRTFTISAPQQKKGGKSSSSKTSVEDPLDLSNLESAIGKAIEKLKDDLSMLRPGGRFNPEVLEALRVHLVKGSKESVRLSDVAQVVPKGRTVQIVVGEPDHVKPVISAIQWSDLSLTPQPDPSHRSTLNITIPPTTGESRQAVIDTATKSGEVAKTGVRNARQAQQKIMRAAESDRHVRPDELRKAVAEMEKIVEKGKKEVIKIVEGKQKVLAQA